LLVLLLLVAGVAVFATRTLYDTAENRYVKESFPLRSAVRDLLLQMVNEETGVRGYLIAGESGALQPYPAARQRVAADLATLERLTARRPEITQDVALVRAQIRDLNTFYADQIALVRAGKTGEAQRNIFAGKAQFDVFRATADRLGRRADEIVQSAQRRQRRTFWLTLALVIAATAVAAAIGLTLLRVVPERLRSLYVREHDARRAAERGARASASLEHVVDAVILLDGDDVIRYWNPSAAALLGVAERLALNHPARELIPFLEDVDPALTRDGGKTVALHAVDGEETWLMINESRFPEGRVLVLRDVTAERLLERAQSEFLVTASHELRTPLAAVYGAARTLGRADLQDPALTGRLLTVIEEESTRLAEIVDRILVSSQLDRRELRLAEERTDVRELCESVLASTTLRTSAHTLTLDAPDEAWARCDPSRLRQVIVNLLDNAVKYSPDGGRIAVHVTAAAERIRIDVHDEGLGMPAREQQRAFDKFYRADPAMIHGIGGSGLGLYISRELVEQMGGEIHVRSEPGIGSTFTLELPRAALH
jgi:two-component system phosphate regulon sensor histidine kinase PhoR